MHSINQHMMHLFRSTLLLILLSLCLFPSLQVMAQGSALTQVIRGNIQHEQTGRGLSDIQVSIPDLALQTTTDETGAFRLEEVPVGRQQLLIRGEGYQDQLIPDLLVQAGKEMVLDLTMVPTLFEEEAVEITANSIREITPVSTRLFTVEESKRFAAVYFDPARMATSFPGVVQSNDQANHLIIRGNSPNGLSWRLEGVDIVNPNHLTNAGTFSDRLSQSGGGTIILSSQMLANSTFSTGAFGAQYGNALSGVFDINFRKGNEENYEFTGQAGVIGIDLSAEGPISKAQGSSFLFNYRYSFTGLLAEMGVTFGGEDIRFQDFAFHVNLPTKKAGNFRLFAMGGISSNTFAGPREDSLRAEQKDRFDIRFGSRMGAVGLTHQYFLGDKTVLNSVVALSGIQGTRIGDYVEDDLQLTRVDEDTLTQQRLSIKTSLTHSFSNRSSLTAGIYANQLSFYLSSRIRRPITSEDWQSLTSTEGSHWLIQPYANWRYQLTSDWELNAGVHAMYFLLNDKSSLEPRLSLAWQPSNRKQSLRLAYGLHSQLQLPGTYFSTIQQTDGEFRAVNEDLGFTRAHHVVLSYRQQLANNLYLRVEPYYQRLFQVPIGTAPNSTFSTLNLLEGYVTDSLVNDGTGENYGLEVTVEKYLDKRYYFLASGSLYESTYTAADGEKRDTRYNGQYGFSFTGGREFERTNKKGKQKLWGVNLRVIYQGGMRAMPIDLEASREIQQTIFDTSNGFTERLPDYFRTDLRVTFKRFRPSYTSTFGIDIQNVSNQENLAFRTYDFLQDEVVEKFQLG
ncbi:MAG: carboxypeptidase regulatory-like domain-containing protein, partial [Bacteroidota bacterium]